MAVPTMLPCPLTNFGGCRTSGWSGNLPVVGSAMGCAMRCQSALGDMIAGVGHARFGLKSPLVSQPRAERAFCHCRCDPLFVMFIPNCGGTACRLACCSVVRLSQGQRLCWYGHGSYADCLC